MSRKLFLRVFSIISAIFSVGLLFLSITGPASFPALTKLTWAHGQAERVTPDEYGVNFRLSGNRTDFFYAKKGGELDDVLSSLNSTDCQPISIAFDPRSPNEGLSTGKFYNVYEVRAPTHVVRSYGEIREGWMGDYKIGYVLVVWFAISCIYLWWVSVKKT